MENNASQTTSKPIAYSENSIKIGIATNPREKDEIFRFRYQIYIEEMSKPLLDINHTHKLLHDELDKWTFLLYAKYGSELIATARINIGTLADFPPEIATFLSLDIFQDCPAQDGDHKFAFITKLMVAPSHRSSPVLYLLMAKCYELSCLNKIQFAFGICNFPLLRLYEQIGLHRYSKNFFLPGYGLAVPIVFPLNDINHLRVIRSPIFRLARKRGAVDTRAVEWFHARFTKHSPIINSQIVTEEELWSILCKRLTYLPTEGVRLLSELSVTEAKKFLHWCSSFVQCDPGNLITIQGDISYSYNILISGKLKSLTLVHPIKEYTLSGQSFGANGLTEHIKHTEDIAAIDASEILVLSGMAFPRFFHSYPDIAHKVVRSLINYH